MSKPPSSPVLAWHYTLGLHLLRILESGHLMPMDTPDTPASESPVLWFSLNQRYEPSAAKSLEVNGARQAPTLPLMRQFGNGVYRLGVSPRTLLSGAPLRRQAGIQKERWQALSQHAKQCGANTSEWYGTVHPVSCGDCVIERLDEHQQWVRVAS
jgi:hypothetical protein